MAGRRRSRITALLWITVRHAPTGPAFAGRGCSPFRAARFPIRTPAVAAADTRRMAAESAFIGNRLRLDSAQRVDSLWRILAVIRKCQEGMRVKEMNDGCAMGRQ